jgi:hypothetical protein
LALRNQTKRNGTFNVFQIEKYHIHSSFRSLEIQMPFSAMPSLWTAQAISLPLVQSSNASITVAGLRQAP